MPRRVSTIGQPRVKVLPRDLPKAEPRRALRQLSNDAVRKEEHRSELRNLDARTLLRLAIDQGLFDRLKLQG